MGHLPESLALAGDLVLTGKDLARRGCREEAHRAFTAALAFDPRREEAWLWRAGTAARPEETLACLHHVLRLNPTNARALRGLAEIGGGSRSTPTDAAPPPARSAIRTLAEPWRNVRSSVALLVFVALSLTGPALSVGPEPSRAPQPPEYAGLRPTDAPRLTISVEESPGPGPAAAEAGRPSDPLPAPAAAAPPAASPLELGPSEPTPGSVGPPPMDAQGAPPRPSPRTVNAAPVPLTRPEAEAGRAAADAPPSPSPSPGSGAAAPIGGPTDAVARRSADPDALRPDGDAGPADRTAKGAGVPRQGPTAVAPEAGPLASRIFPQSSPPRNPEPATAP